MAFTRGTVFGHYEIHSLLGAGGMGEVYRALDTKLNRPVAIKFVRRPEDPSDASRKRFLREAQAAASFNHPNIVTVHEVCEADAHIYIVMELVEGRSLRARINAGDFGPAEALDAAAQLADALAEAHARGLLHRDIKPENVIVSARGQAKLLDFGLARAFEHERFASADAETVVMPEHLTNSGTIIGTIPYMSPEQMRGERLDTRSDVFSFGLVLYEMLTGRHPFAGANMFEVGASIIGPEPARTDALEGFVPPGVAGLVARLLEKERGNRPSSCAWVRDALLSLRQQMQSGDFAPATTRPSAPSPAAPPSPRPSAPAPQQPPSSPQYFTAPRAPHATPTVIVLPFEAADREDDTRLIGLGLASVITTELARVAGLSVISKSASATQGVEPGRDARAHARELGASLMLEGEVQRAARRVRIASRLIDVESGRVVWGQRFKGEDSDLFQMQDEVCEGIVSALRGSLSGAPLAPGGTHAPANLESFVLYSKGRAFLERHDVAENIDLSIQMFEESLRHDPEFALAHAGLSEACWQKYQHTRDEAWVRRAIESGDRALVYDPEQAEVHVSLGMVYYGTSRTEMAVEELRRAIALQPACADAYMWLGRCYTRKGEIEEAIRNFNRAIDIRPGYWANYNYLGACYSSAGRYQEAAEQFRRVISIQPDNHDGYNNLGGVYCLLGRYDDAVRMHRQAIKIRPAATGYSNLGTDLFFLGRYGEAVEAYREAIRLNERNDLYRRNLGDALQRIGRGAEADEQYEQACRLLRKSLTVQPDDAELLGRLAVCLAKLRRAPEALATVARAAALQPHNTTLMYKSAVVRALAGQTAEAAAALALALRHGYSRAEAGRDPDLAALRDAPEYAASLEAAGAPDAA